MYQQNCTTYAIFREDECFMRRGEYNVSLMWILWRSVSHLTPILRGEIEHSASLCLLALTLSHCIIHVRARVCVRACVSIFVLFVEIALWIAPLAAASQGGSVGKRERSRQREDGCFYQFEKSRILSAEDLWTELLDCFCLYRCSASICVCCLW